MFEFDINFFIWFNSNFGFQQPTVSVGNVGQLAVDLLISTLKAKHVGFLYTDCVVPVVGGDPFAPPGSQDSKQITTSVDGKSVSKKLFISFFCMYNNNKNNEFNARFVFR